MFALFFVIFAVAAIFFFFFNDTATTEIYTLSLHDALPIYPDDASWRGADTLSLWPPHRRRDRKSTRLNSSPQSNLVCRLLLEKKNAQEYRFALTFVMFDLSAVVCLAAPFACGGLLNAAARV